MLESMYCLQAQYSLLIIVLSLHSMPVYAGLSVCYALIVLGDQHNITCESLMDWDHYVLPLLYQVPTTSYPPISAILFQI